jgi:DNA end-binding protein Ku
MPQAVWTGTISFGLVSIPVRLYPATQPKDVRFHLYDRRSGKRIHYERVIRDEEPSVFEPDPQTAGERTELATPARSSEPSHESLHLSEPQRASVGAHDLVRGIELPEGDLVTVTDEELSELAPERSRTIDLEEFVDLSDIDPTFYEKTYYVAPGRGNVGDKPYVLLHRAMRSAGMVGIGRFVLRTKPHLVAIRPLEEALALHTLYFGDEVRSPQEFARVSGVSVADREVKMAKDLIGAMATPWSPDSHSDAYRQGLLDLLRSKSPMKQAPMIDTARTPGGEVEDLMAALRSSVEAVKKRNAQSSTKGSTGKRAG